MRHREGDPRTHGIPKEMRARDVEVSEDRDDIGDIVLRLVGLGIMRFVARAMPAGIDEDKSVIPLQGVNIAEFVPGLDTVSESMLNYQRRTFAFSLVMNALTWSAAYWAVAKAIHAPIEYPKKCARGMSRSVSTETMSATLRSGL